MNLYKITFSHHAPKGSNDGIKGFLLANDDKEVYDFIINSKDERGFNNFYMGWDDRDDYGDDEEKETFEIFDEKWNVVASFEKYSEYILYLKGDINDESYDFSDSYYGITRMGWELVVENPGQSLIDSLNLVGVLYQKSHP